MPINWVQLNVLKAGKGKGKKIEILEGKGTFGTLTAQYPRV